MVDESAQDQIAMETDSTNRILFPAMAAREGDRACETLADCDGRATVWERAGRTRTRMRSVLLVKNV